VNDVRLGVYHVAGRLVQEIDHSSVAAGSYERTWDRRDASGAWVARGVYVLRQAAGAEVVLRKIVLLSE